MIATTFLVEISNKVLAVIKTAAVAGGFFLIATDLP
jgi:hypothetical protein